MLNLIVGAFTALLVAVSIDLDLKICLFHHFFSESDLKSLTFLHFCALNALYFVLSVDLYLNLLFVLADHTYDSNSLSLA